jgi:hypothetical protein
MSSHQKLENGSTRRVFVKKIAGAAGIAVTGTMASAFLPAKAATPSAEEQPSSPQAPGSKYRKYFLNELTPEEREKGFGAQSMFLVFSDDDIIEGSQFVTALMMGESATKIAGHGPHFHPHPEILVALGTDPEHPHELGAEFEVYMGEEMEKHVIDKPTVIYIPARMLHCPFRVTKVTRPFLFIDMQLGSKMAERAMRDLVPPDMRDKYIFIDADGTQKDTYIPPAQRVKHKSG